MNTKLFITIVILLTGIHSVTPQSKISPREMFLEAESYFLYEEYNEAMPLYAKLSVLYPQNDNINYRLGRCFLNIPLEKEKAIFYLEKASKNINPKHKGDNLKETSAPKDALYYLGDAYRINNELDKAIAQYKHFKETSDPDIFDHQLVDEQIRACENARLLQKEPLEIGYTNIGKVINTHFSESNPVISGDESVMVFSAQLRFYPAVFFTEKQNGNWTSPVNINPELGVDDDCFPVSISYNGKEMILYRNNEYLGDLYVSRFVDGKWSKIKKLNSNINTRFWESHASFSKDGKKLFFTSNRNGGFGDLDIYVSEREDISQDNWGAPRNLGPNVNSPHNEETPFLSFDDQKLYFSSQGHNSIGGYDIFISELNNDGTWSKPQNAGYPLNTTDNDLFYQPVRNGNEGYMALYRKDSYGKNDIYKIKITSSDEQLTALNEKLQSKAQKSSIKDVEDNYPKADKVQNEEKELITMPVHKLNAENTNLQVTQTLAKNSEVNVVKARYDSTSLKTTSDTSLTISPDNDPTLSSGQLKAWHKMLYGGLGILSVFAFFILSLYLRSRKKKT